MSGIINHDKAEIVNTEEIENKLEKRNEIAFRWWFY